MGFWNSLFGGGAGAGRSPNEVAEMARNAVIVDVRTPGEYQTGRIEGSRNIPLSDLGRRHAEIPADGTVVVVCHAGTRSKMAVRRLKSLGHDNLVNLDGGLVAWQRAGLPVSR